MKWEMPDLFADMPELSPVNKEAPVPGEMRIRLGTSRKTGEPVYWRPDSDGCRNVCVIGGADTGKSQQIKSLVVQLVRQRRSHAEDENAMGILVLDYKGDYNESSQEFLDETNAKVLKLHSLSLNPFSLKNQAHRPQLHVHIAMAFADAMALSYGLNPIQKSTLVQSVMDAYADCGITAEPETWDRPAPTFATVYEAYCARPRAQHNDSLEGIMESLAALELFEDDSGMQSDRFRDFWGVAVVDLSGYSASLKNLAAILILEQCCAQMYQSDFSPGRMKKLLLLDEADDVLVRGCPVLDRILLEGGRYGVGLVLSIRNPDCLRNLHPDVRGLISLWMIHNAEDLKKADLCYVLCRDIYDPGMEQLYQSVRKLSKHHSLLCADTHEPIVLENLPFFEISRDAGESYLREPVVEMVEEVQTGMPELDIGHLTLADLSEDIRMEPLDGLLDLE